MTLCPVAIAMTCKKCPVVGFCPAKGIVGDYKEDEADQASGSKNPTDSKAQEKK